MLPKAAPHRGLIIGARDLEHRDHGPVARPAGVTSGGSGAQVIGAQGAVDEVDDVVEEPREDLLGQPTPPVLRGLGSLALAVLGAQKQGVVRTRMGCCSF
jgi:hypothetical protein